MHDKKLLPLLSSKKRGLSGGFIVPGDKSISHRSLLISSQAIGTSRINNLLEGEDVINTAHALKSLGVNIKKEKNIWCVDGVGVGGLVKSEKALDMGNSGTAARLMMGLLSSYPFETVFTGDKSLKKRPMNRVMEPLVKMGAMFSSEDGGLLPISVKGDGHMVPINYQLPVPSAQVKSAIILAALNIPGKTTVTERTPTRDHTEIMLKYFGVNISNKNGKIAITGQPEFNARDINIPADPSSAAFPIIAAIITPDSEVIVRNVCINPLRIGLYKTLKQMGAKIEFINKRESAGEKIADIKASYSKLKAITIPPEIAPSMIDEYPILAVAASVADGETVMEGLGELKVKESNRLDAVKDGLLTCGVKCRVSGDSLIVEGSNKIKGGSVKTHMDHRIAMSFLVLGLVSENGVKIDDSSMINTSFPDFIKIMNKLGANILPC